EMVRIQEGLGRWITTRFQESEVRCSAEMSDGRTIDDLQQPIQSLEPAFTFRCLWLARGGTGFEGNRKAEKRILLLMERRGAGNPFAQKQLRRDLAKLPELSDRDVEQLIYLLTAKNPAQRIFIRTGTTMRLGEEEGRDALDVVITPV